METESAVTENRWTNANENSSSNSFSSETEMLKKRRNDKAQRSFFPSFSSGTDFEESEYFSRIASEGFIENPWNSQEEGDEHETEEETQNVDSSASWAFPEATSITFDNVCLHQLNCGGQKFIQATCCKMSDSVHNKLQEYAKRIVNQNICFPPADMVCEVKPKYSGMTNSSHLYLKHLIGSCFYEYDIKCAHGINSLDHYVAANIDAT